MFALRPKATMLPAVANEAVGGRAASATAIEAQSTFGNTVSTVAASRSGWLIRDAL
jgi:hypothetical protein